MNIDFEQERSREPFVSAWVSDSGHPAIACGRVVSEAVVDKPWDPARLDIFPGCEGIADREELEHHLALIATMMDVDVDDGVEVEVEEEEEWHEELHEELEENEEAVVGRSDAISLCPCVQAQPTPTGFNLMGSISVSRRQVCDCCPRSLGLLCVRPTAVCCVGVCTPLAGYFIGSGIDTTCGGPRGR